MIFLALALQTASTTPPPVPEKFSILVPVGDEPCTRQSGKDAEGRDIVICGNALPSQKLPYPDEVVPDGPTPSNPFRSGTGALASEGTPCAISHSCIVGFGPPIVPILKGAADVAKRAFARKPDKTGRVPIDLSDPGPPVGHIEP